MSGSEPPEDVSNDELWNRLRRLEKKVFPDRRDVLKAGAMGAAGAAIGFGSGTASAQTASGQVGTSSNPVDVKGATVNAGQVTSESLPIWRVYQYGNETVAVDETDTEISRNTNPSIVWQDALDQANTQFDPNQKFEPVAVIDGGQLLYNLQSGITVKDGAIVQNARFEASSLASPSQAVTFGGPDDGFTHGAIGGKNILVRDAADVGVRFRDLAVCRFSDITVEDSVGDNIEIQSCLLSTFDTIHSRNAGSRGYLVNDSGDTLGQVNTNTFVNCRAVGASGAGINTANEQVQDNLFVSFTAENNGGNGVVDSGEGNVWESPWCESNTNRGMILDGDRITVKQPKITDNNGGGGGTQGIRIGGAPGSVVIGPATGNDQVNVASGADCDLRALEPGDLFSANASRVRWDGVIGGGPLGGVDLTVVAPSQEGVKAMSDGTATGFPKYAEARRDTTNVQWVRVDGQATV